MGLGVLEDHKLDHVPGTTQFFDDPERPQFAADGSSHLKTDDSGPIPVILVPQPSDNPNDPLNWPMWKRDLITFALSMAAIFATSLGPILAANTVTLSLWFERDFAQIAELTGYFLLGTGVGAIFWVPSSRVYGKRHTFVIGALIVVVAAAWGGGSRRNYRSMLWARIFQGVGTAPYEALVNAAVGDLYCVHQRGIRMAFTNLAVFGGAFFTPILVGKITHTIMWWWTFYLVAIFMATCVPLIYLFCPETAYRRDAALNIDLLAEEHHEKPQPQAQNSDSGDGEAEPKTSGGTTSATAPSTDIMANEAAPATPSPAKYSFRESTYLFNGRKTDEHFWKLLLRPFPLFLQPAFLWAVLVQGAMIGWTVFIGVILAQFTLGYPLWWDEVKTGYAYTGAFIGAVGGFIVAGVLSDWSARLLTKWNNGVYEPEFRLVLIIPQFIFGVMGLYGFGITVDGVLKKKFNYAVPLTFFGFEVAGMVIGAVSTSLYLVDAYRDLVIEGFTCQIIFKNFFSFALTFKAYEWLIVNSTKATPVFNALGSAQVVICLTTIPMYIFGKRVRSFYHRHDILSFFKVR